MHAESTDHAAMAPELEVSAWLNTAQPLSLQTLRGRVVMLHAFQMLCPGCVSHGLPQASAVHEQFAAQGVAVIGLHSVFEHHAVMGPDALAAFVHEYRLHFPIAIDRASTSGPIPRTMAAYGMRGTPSVVLIDRQGALRVHHFGRIGDLALGAALGHLLAEVGPAAGATVKATQPGAGCSPDGCAID